MNNLFKKLSNELSQNIKINLRNYEEYLIVEKGLRPLTIQHKLTNLKTFFVRCGIKSLNEITLFTVKDFFYKQVLDNGWSSNTYRNYWKNLRCFFNWAIYNHILSFTVNPVEQIDKPKAHKVKPRRLSKDQVQKLFAVCSTYSWKYRIQRARNTAIFATFLYTGIRINELLHIKVIDCSFSQRTILIRHGKGGKVRIVKVPRELIRFLQDFESNIKRLNIKREYFFCTIGEYKKMTRKNIYSMCKVLIEATNIYFTPHMLRHTFASMCAEQKVPLVSIAETMGHSSTYHTETYITPEQEIRLSHLDSLPFFL